MRGLNKACGCFLTALTIIQYGLCVHNTDPDYFGLGSLSPEREPASTNTNTQNSASEGRAAKTNVLFNEKNPMVFGSSLSASAEPTFGTFQSENLQYPTGSSVSSKVGPSIPETQSGTATNTDHVFGTTMFDQLPPSAPADAPSTYKQNGEVVNREGLSQSNSNFMFGSSVNSAGAAENSQPNQEFSIVTKTVTLDGGMPQNHVDHVVGQSNVPPIPEPVISQSNTEKSNSPGQYYGTVSNSQTLNEYSSNSLTQQQNTIPSQQTLHQIEPVSNTATGNYAPAVPVNQADAQNQQNNGNVPTVTAHSFTSEPSYTTQTERTNAQPNYDVGLDLFSRNHETSQTRMESNQQQIQGQNSYMETGRSATNPETNNQQTNIADPMVEAYLYSEPETQRQPSNRMTNIDQSSSSQGEPQLSSGNQSPAWTFNSKYYDTNSNVQGNSQPGSNQDYSHFAEYQPSQDWYSNMFDASRIDLTQYSSENVQQNNQNSQNDVQANSQNDQWPSYQNTVQDIFPVQNTDWNNWNGNFQNVDQNNWDSNSQDMNSQDMGQDMWQAQDTNSFQDSNSQDMNSQDMGQDMWQAQDTNSFQDSNSQDMNSQDMGQDMWQAQDTNSFQDSNSQNMNSQDMGQDMWQAQDTNSFQDSNSQNMNSQDMGLDFWQTQDSNSQDMNSQNMGQDMWQTQDINNFQGDTSQNDGQQSNDGGDVYGQAESQGDSNNQDTGSNGPDNDDNSDEDED